MPFERTIKVAFDRISGEVTRADAVFHKMKYGFELRKKTQVSDSDFFCCECNQKLIVSTSKYDRLHFKHQVNAAPCILKDKNFSPQEKEQLTAFYESKESKRHKQLKYDIGKKLADIEGVHNIVIDNKFIIDGEERRKPDVFCKYRNRALAFEIQLSNLSLKYIVNRHEFYLRNEIYLIWILDDFDVNGKKQMERDIKHLTRYQNFFKLDERSKDFKLRCKYKIPYLNEDNEIQEKWHQRSVAIQQLNFSVEYQIYYYNYYDKKIEIDKSRVKRIQQYKEEQQKAVELEKLKKAKGKADRTFNQLRDIWKNKIVNFDLIELELEHMDDYEISVLNNSSELMPVNNQPKIHHWFKIAQKEHFHFLQYMLDHELFYFDVNQRSNHNRTLLFTLFANNRLESKFWLMKKMIKRGYVFKAEDEELLLNLNFSSSELDATKVLCYLANNVHDKNMIQTLFDHEKVFCSIESARQNRIIGFAYKPHEWIAFANNAINSYEEYWDYIEIAFKHYGIWEKLISLDKKGTFLKKLEKFYYTSPKQNHDCDRVFQELYPEMRG